MVGVPTVPLNTVKKPLQQLLTVDTSSGPNYGTPIIEEMVTEEPATLVYYNASTSNQVITIAEGIEQPVLYQGLTLNPGQSMAFTFDGYTRIGQSARYAVASANGGSLSVYMTKMPQLQV